MPAAEPKQLMEGASTYVEKQKIFQLFEGLMQDLIINKPDDPIAHLISKLKRKSVPRVIVAGPPGAQARSLCELLAAKQDLVHVVAADVWRELARLSSPNGLKAKALVDQGGEVPSGLLLELLQEKLGSGDCMTKGWVLEGYPNTQDQTRAMLASGLLPSRFLHVALDDTEVMRRLTGRRVDPDANIIYHVDDAPPPDAETAARLIQRADDSAERVASRLGAYRSAMRGVLPCFSKTLKEVDGSLPNAALLEAALPFITAELPTRAPRGCPRVMLLGGPGSRAEALGGALASVYGAKLISATELLHAAALGGSRQAARAVELPSLDMVELDLIGPLVLGRLQQEDVRTCGFVLQGFPATAAQAAWLKKRDVWVRHAVHLELSGEEATAAVCGTRYDPLDGAIYHVTDNVPADPEVAGRLVLHPKHEAPIVKAALKAWAAAKGPLLQAFKDVVSTERATRPEGELVERLAPCFLTL